MTSIWTPTRCRVLTAPDKKQIMVIRSIIDTLAVEATTKTNDMDTLFSKLRSLVSTIVPSPESDTSLYTVTKADIASLHELINKGEKQHREDEYKDLFDEAKLRPVAHRCMELWNKIEGFESNPFEDLSEEERTKKKARFEAVLAKRREVEEKKRAAQTHKEEEVLRRQELKKVLAAPVQAGLATVEDSTIPDAPPLAFVDYINIPLVEEEEEDEDASAAAPPPTALTYYAEFERALEVWTFLVSLPEPIKLSQFSFSSFITALKTPNETHLIESIFSALVQTGVRGSPNIPSPKQVEQQMRGNPWFKRALQFFDIASGRKQEREKAQKKKALAKKRQREELEDEEDDEEEEGETSEEAEEVDESSSASSSVAVEVEKEDVQDDDEEKTDKEVVEVEDEAPAIMGFDAELKALSDELQSLGRLALWVNLSIGERLVFLKFLVDCVMEAPVVIAAADALERQEHKNTLAFERRVKELKDGADKRLKQLTKTLLSTPQNGTPGGGGGEEPATETRESIVEDLKKAIQKELTTMIKKSEGGEVGARVLPIGQDRYRRLYWRFPLESSVYVQTTAETRPFPLAERPAKAKMLLDDEEDDNVKKGANTAQDEPKPLFQIWGKICAEHLPAFVATLDKRGTREAHLKAQLEPLIPHLVALGAPPTPSVMTRSRATYGGYRNTFLEL